MKRTLAILLTLILALSAVSFSAFAEEEISAEPDTAPAAEDVSDEDLIDEDTSDETASLEVVSDEEDLALSGAQEDVALSGDSIIKYGFTGTCVWLYNGFASTLQISGDGGMIDYQPDFTDKPWNEYCANIKSIIILDGVRDIGDYAFNNCRNVTSITFGNSVRSIGTCAFSGIKKIDPVTIPDSVTKLEPGAFMTSGLTGVTFGSGLKEIGEQAFQDCALTNVTIPGTIKTIGRKAFYGNVGLTNVQIENGVETIGDYAFLNTYLGGVTIPKSVLEFGLSPFAYDVTYNEATHSNTYTPVNPFIIKGYTNSVAETYAKQRSFISFISIGVSSNYHLSGIVTSALESSDTTTVEFYKPKHLNPSYTINLTGNTVSYKINNIDVSIYTVTVSKKNHVTRKYSVSITQPNQTLITAINPLGDVNLDGKVTIRDVNNLYNHVKGSGTITDSYSLECGDVYNPGSGVNIRDVNTLYNHVKGKVTIY